jgi:hypothetical protein
MELRCRHKLHGVVNDGLLEFKCGSSFCGAGSGVVVIHQFDPITGQLVNTKRYKDTPIINNNTEGARDALGHRTAIRSA